MNTLISVDPGSYKTGVCLWIDNGDGLALIEVKNIELKKRYGKYALSAPQRCGEIVRRLNEWATDWLGDIPLSVVAYEAPQVPGQNQKALTMLQGAIAGWAGLRGATVYDYHQSTLKALLLPPPHTKAAAQRYVLQEYPGLKNRSEDEIDAVFTGLAHIKASAL